MGFTKSLTICALALWVVFAGSTSADEVVIDRNTASKVKLGEFDCSSCSTNSFPKFILSSQNGDFEATAGQIWQFLDRQGVTSAKKLTLCLDLDLVDDDLDFSLRAIELRIESPEEKNKFLTIVNLGGNSILVPGYETSEYKPEAKFEVLLGYDFMEKFSSDSQQKVVIKLDCSSDLSGCSPTIFLQSQSLGFFSSKKNFIFLAGFAFFWVCVFHLLNRFTKPSNDIERSNASPSLQVDPVMALTRVEPQKVMSA